MVLLILDFLCFVSCSNTIVGFSWFIRSFRALVLEGCPNPLLFYDSILIISIEGLEELLFLLYLCMLCLYLLFLVYMILLDSGFLVLCPFAYSRPCAVWKIFCQVSFDCLPWIPWSCFGLFLEGEDQMEGRRE